MRGSIEGIQQLLINLVDLGFGKLVCNLKSSMVTPILTRERDGTRMDEKGKNLGFLPLVCVSNTLGSRSTPAGYQLTRTHVFTRCCAWYDQFFIQFWESGEGRRRERGKEGDGAHLLIHSLDFVNLMISAAFYTTIQQWHKE